MMKPKFAYAFLLSITVLAGACGGDDDGNTIPPSVIPDAAPIVPDASMCSPLQQDCGDGSKCSLDLTQTATMTTWGATCRAVTGTAGFGEACMRSAEGAAGVGKDTCIAGAYCTAIGSLNGDTSPAARHCTSFCSESSSCSKGQECFALTEGFTPAVGICTNSCTVLGTGTCSDGAWCGFTSNIEGHSMGQCIKPGTASLGATCDAMTACVTGAICITTTAQTGEMTSACLEVCDVAAGDAGPSHACPTGSTCRPLSSGPQDYGVCQPN
jgi:hypothetical protein